MIRSTLSLKNEKIVFVTSFKDPFSFFRKDNSDVCPSKEVFGGLFEVKSGNLGKNVPSMSATVRKVNKQKSNLSFVYTFELLRLIVENSGKKSPFRSVSSVRKNHNAITKCHKDCYKSNARYNMRNDNDILFENNSRDKVIRNQSHHVSHVSSAYSGTVPFKTLHKDEKNFKDNF